MNSHMIEKQLVEFLKSVTGQDELNGQTDLLEAGVTDSLTMMDLLVFIETDFQVRIDFTDLTPEVFRTAHTIARLISVRTENTRRTEAA